MQSTSQCLRCSKCMTNSNLHPATLLLRVFVASTQASASLQAPLQPPQTTHAHTIISRASLSISTNMSLAAIICSDESRYPLKRAEQGASYGGVLKTAGTPSCASPKCLVRNFCTRIQTAWFQSLQSKPRRMQTKNGKVSHAI